MPDYDFRTLNEREFESFVNQAVGASRGVVVEQFKPGKDGGIDGRFKVQDGWAIIQAKHWYKTGLDKLLRHLQKVERPKLDAMKPAPKRYVLATSLDLSPANKTAICKIFKPFLLGPEDVLGRDDLNGILAAHPDVEKANFKLWIASTAVLEEVLHRAVLGRSGHEMAQTVTAAKLYVRTAAHSSAKTKLHKNKAVIISGAPGIGKTTLARQLWLELAADGFEPVWIEESLTDAEDVYVLERKQVFLLDDFLGRNYLSLLQGKTDSRILSFIRRVQSDKGKRLILTSRTVILNRALVISEPFKAENLRVHELEIVISKISRLDRATILYNHIWFGDLDSARRGELFRDKRYRKVIDHQNFNPRLVAYVTDLVKVGQFEPGAYWQEVESLLARPKDVWAHLFDRQLDDHCRQLVRLVVVNGKDVAESELQAAFMRLNCAADQADLGARFEQACATTLGAIITRVHDLRSSRSSYRAFDPSVADFVLGRMLGTPSVMAEYLVALRTSDSREHIRNLLGGNAGSEISTIGRAQFAVRLVDLATEMAAADAAAAWGVLVLAVFVGGIDDETSDQLRRWVTAHATATSCARRLDAASLLTWHLGKWPDEAVIACAVAIIEQRSPSSDGENELLAMVELARCLPIGPREGCIEACRATILLYWTDFVEDFLQAEDILANFDDPRNTDAASEAVVTAVERELAKYRLGFDSDDAWSVIEGLDIEAKIRDRHFGDTPDDDDAYERWKEGEGRGSDDDTTIDDLFRWDAL